MRPATVSGNNWSMSDHYDFSIRVDIAGKRIAQNVYPVISSRTH